MEEELQAVIELAEEYLFISSQKKSKSLDEYKKGRKNELLTMIVKTVAKISEELE